MAVVSEPAILSTEVSRFPTRERGEKGSLHVCGGDGHQLAERQLGRVFVVDLEKSSKDVLPIHRVPLAFLDHGNCELWYKSALVQVSAKTIVTSCTWLTFSKLGNSFGKSGLPIRNS